MKNIQRIAAVTTLCLAFPWQALAAGAIAVDEDQDLTAYGASSGRDSKFEAGRIALGKCVETGHHSCKVAVRYEYCGAYAASWRFSSTGTGRTKAEAIANALKDCSECKVVVADCEGAQNANLLAASYAK
ncbi:hypothetical protein BWI17_10205 [Betaproteobacteria bacterium GR16-43]|nr:hypothetical protein BWI17_10205 [Betaproteobacteria bacterium GR16-43]